MEEQTFSFMDFLKAFVSNSVSDYAAAMRQRKFGSTLLEIPHFRFFQFSGTYRGFNQTPSMNERLKQRFYYPDKEGYPTRRGGSDADEDRTIQNAVEESNGEEIDYSNVAISGEVGLE
jgi:hypothetical protein